MIWVEVSVVVSVSVSVFVSVQVVVLVVVSVQVSVVVSVHVTVSVVVETEVTVQVCRCPRNNIIVRLSCPGGQPKVLQRMIGYLRQLREVGDIGVGILCCQTHRQNR